MKLNFAKIIQLIRYCDNNCLILKISFQNVYTIFELIIPQFLKRSFFQGSFLINLVNDLIII